MLVHTQQQTHELPYSGPLSFSFYIYRPLGELNYIILPCSRYRWYLEILKVGEGTRLAASARISAPQPCTSPALVSVSAAPNTAEAAELWATVSGVEQKNYYACVPLGRVRNWTLTSSGI